MKLEDMPLTDAYRQFKADLEAFFEARGHRESLLKVLQARKFQLSSEQRTRIQNTSDIKQLDDWLVKAVAATSLSEVLE